MAERPERTSNQPNKQTNTRRPGPRSGTRSERRRPRRPSALVPRQLLRLLSLAPPTPHHDIHIVRTAEHMPATRRCGRRRARPPCGRPPSLSLQLCFLRRGCDGGGGRRGLCCRCCCCGGGGGGGSSSSEGCGCVDVVVGLFLWRAVRCGWGSSGQKCELRCLFDEEAFVAAYRALMNFRTSPHF